jgi:Flp pilus assembly protein TadG
VFGEYNELRHAVREGARYAAVSDARHRRNSTIDADDVRHTICNALGLGSPNVEIVLTQSGTAIGDVASVQVSSTPRASGRSHHQYLRSRPAGEHRHLPARTAGQVVGHDVREHVGRDQRMLNREKGATALLVASSLIMLIGFAAVAVDLSAGFNERRQGQTAADLGALAGAVEYVTSTRRARSTRS